MGIVPGKYRGLRKYSLQNFFWPILCRHSTAHAKPGMKVIGNGRLAQVGRFATPLHPSSFDAQTGDAWPVLASHLRLDSAR
jgi:hypothetical protein